MLDVALLSFNCRSIARTRCWQLVLNLGHWLAVPGWHVSNFFPRSPLPEFVVPFSGSMYLLELCRVGLVSSELAQFLGSLLEACSARVRPFGPVAAVTVRGGHCLGLAPAVAWPLLLDWPRVHSLSRGASGLALAGPVCWPRARCSTASSGRVACAPCHALAGTGCPPVASAGPQLCRSARLRADPGRCRGHRCGVNASPPALRSLVPTGCRACVAVSVVWLSGPSAEARRCGYAWFAPLAATDEPRSGSAHPSCAPHQALVSSPVCPGFSTANDRSRPVLRCPNRLRVHCTAAPGVEPSSLLPSPFCQFELHSLISSRKSVA
jgi:hypothetical protein